MSGHDEALVAKAAEAIAEWRWGRSCHPASSADFARARAVLDAVADDLRAEALREAADDMKQFEPFPGEEPDWLRERADRIEARDV